MGRRSNSERIELPRVNRIQEAVRQALQHNKREGDEMVFGPMKKTQFPELNYQKHGDSVWRLYDAATLSVIGPVYPTETALLGDLNHQHEFRFSTSYAARHSNSKPTGEEVAESNPIKETKRPEFRYQRQDSFHWRLIDVKTWAFFGPVYETEVGLLADVDNQYAIKFPAPAPKPVHWIDTIKELLTKIATHYEKTAPTVNTWANELFRRIGEDTDAVRLSELVFVEILYDGGKMTHPNVAANLTYKLMARLNQDVTGQAGF